MDQSVNSSNNSSPTFFSKLQENIFRWIRLTGRPSVFVYHGYGNGEECVIFGHALSRSPLPRKKYRRNLWTNTLALIRLFMVKPLPFARLELRFQGRSLAGTAEKDGFFRFQWQPEVPLAPGWHEVEVRLQKADDARPAVGALIIPPPSDYAIVSDIDDTFLVSHSSTWYKRLYVLLTENAFSRKPFEEVVTHYQRLSKGTGGDLLRRPFFYVSSSEWNLYQYILDFSRKNGLPPGVYLLNQLKTISQIWRTGQNNHSTKFVRISRLMEAFPSRQFVLLGDDSQQDPMIYAALVQHFPNRVKAVYLRQIRSKRRQKVHDAIATIANAGVPVCHFAHSRTAIEHSTQIGLIDESS